MKLAPRLIPIVIILVAGAACGTSESEQAVGAPVTRPAVSLTPIEAGVSQPAVATAVSGSTPGSAAVDAAATRAGAGPAEPAPSAIPPRPIPNWWPDGLVPEFVGHPATPVPVPGEDIPPHPHLAPTGQSTMHGDGYSSDTHPSSGPLGVHPEVISTARAPIGGECATVTFDRRGRLVTVCASFTSFHLALLDPVTLAELARHELPQRPSILEFISTLDLRKLRKITTDTSGGAYFFLDDEDRVVLADSRQHIVRVGLEETADGPAFRLEDDWDLSGLLPRDCWSPENPEPQGQCDVITAVMPDWDGRLWWVSRYGRVGTLDPQTGATRVIELEGEEIQNSFSVAQDGVYIVSDHALYGFAADAATGAPVVVWRKVYDRGSGPKPGSINQGSGTTPTLLGSEYAAVTDNADGHINVLVYRRRPEAVGERLVCRQPLFLLGQSATENSLIGYGDSLVAESNYGYENFLSLLFGRATVGGVTRIDIEPGGTGCHVAWESRERSPSVVPKLSLANGLVYLYTKDPHPLWIDAWYLTALDFRTGETVYKVLVGTGWGYDNHWAPITLGPNGTAYVGTFNGMVAVRDSR